MTARPAGRFEWEQLFRRCLLPSTVKAVGFAMATYADSDGSRIWPGAALLAHNTGLSERSVRAALGTLRELELVSRVVKGGHRGTQAIADAYQLAIPEELFERVDLLTPDGELPPNRQQVPLRKVSQPAGDAASEVPNRHQVPPQPAAGAAQPAPDDVPTGTGCTPPSTYTNHPTRPQTRSAVVPIRAEPQNARADRCEKYGHEYGGWPCHACSSESKAAS